MARIPTGEGLGNAVGRPVLRNEIATPRGAFGVQGVEELGAAVYREGARLDVEERQREAEQKALREQADRATASGKLLDVEDKLTAAHDDIANGVKTGQIDKTKASEAWRARAAEITADVGPGVPEAHRQQWSNGAQRLTQRLDRSLRIVVEERDRHDVRTGLDQTLEYASRMYGKDPAKATQYATDALTQLGPFTGLPADQLARIGQKWKEDAAYTAAYTGVNSARGDMAALKEWDKRLAADETLDPQKKAQLLNTSLGYQTHLETQATARAQRAAIVEERAARAAAETWNGIQTLVEAGKVPDAQTVANAAAQFKGRPYEKFLPQLLEEAKGRQAFALQPLDVQRAALAGDRAQLNAATSPGAEKAYAERLKTTQAAEREVKTDPLRAYTDRFLRDQPLPPLDLSNLQATAAGLAQRQAIAEEATRWSGAKVAPLYAEEVDGVRRQLEPLAPRERAAAVATLTQALGPKAAQGLAAQLDGKDKALSLMFEYAGTMTNGPGGNGQGRQLSEIIARGKLAKADGTSTKGESEPALKHAQWQAAIARQLDGVFPSATDTERRKEAAGYVVHALAAEAGGKVDKDTIRNAVDLAVGGHVVEFNGARIPLPPGADEGMVEKRLKAVTPAEVTAQAPEGQVRAGGVAVPVTDFVKSLPAAQLLYVQPGRYAVLANGRPVTNTRGVPILIGF